MSDKERAKDVHNSHGKYIDGLSDHMQKFVESIYSIENGKYKNIRLTSGKRDAHEGDRFSHHHTGNAIDIAAIGESGELGQDLYSYLMNTEEGLLLMKDFGLGIIDETDPETMKKTGASGPHFHIGMDTKYVDISKKRLDEFHSGSFKPTYSYISANPYTNVSTNPSGESNANRPQEPTTGLVPPNFEVRNDPMYQVFMQALNDTKEKEDTKESKIEESKARQKIEDIKNEKLKAEEQRKAEFIKMLSEINTIEAPKPIKQKEFEPVQYQMAIPDSNLPSLPSIHQIPGFQDGGELDDNNPPSELTEQDKYFYLLDRIRQEYKHLDPTTHKYVEGTKYPDFGAGPIKGLEDKGFTPITTEDFVTWKVSNDNFTPDPTKFVELGFSGADKSKFEQRFKSTYKGEEANYQSDFDQAWSNLTSEDRVVLAPRETDKYGTLWVPIGTGKQSQKLTEDFNKEFGRHYTKKSQIIPYYDILDDEAHQKKYAQSFYDWKQKQLGEFGSGVQQQKFGGLFKYDNGGEYYTYSGREGAKYKKDGDKWLINLGEQTNNQYIPIKDPTGERSRILNENAVRSVPSLKDSFLNNYNPYGGIGTPEFSETTSRPLVTQAINNEARIINEDKAIRRYKLEEGRKKIINDQQLSDEEKKRMLSNSEEIISFYDVSETFRQNQGTIKKKLEQDSYSRMLDYANNPDAALYYAMKGEAMPSNYQSMMEAGINPAREDRGGNLILSTLNDFLNPAHSINSAVNNISQGDYLNALYDVATLIPGARTLKTFDNVTDLFKTGRKVPLNQPIRSIPLHSDNVYIPPEEMGFNPFKSKVAQGNSVRVEFNPQRSEVLGGITHDIKLGNEKIGEISGNYTRSGDLEVFDVGIDKAYQNKGYGKEAYRQLNESLPNNKVISFGAYVEDAAEQFPGKNLWESLVRSGEAEKVGHTYHMINPNIKAGMDGNFITRPLTPFGKNEILAKPGYNMNYRKIGNEAGLRDLINKGGAQAPGSLKMKSGLTIDTPFFGTGEKPTESYKGLYAVEIDPRNPKYRWSSRVGGTNNYGVAPFNSETGELVKNIPLEDLNVYRKKWFSNNYKKLDPNNLEAGLKNATTQRLLEAILKWGIRGALVDQLLNDGEGRGAISNALQNTESYKFQEGGEVMELINKQNKNGYIRLF